MPEILIAGNQRNVVIQTRLGNKRISEPSLKPSSPNARAKLTGALPVPLRDDQLRHRRNGG